MTGRWLARLWAWLRVEENALVVAVAVAVLLMLVFYGDSVACSVSISSRGAP